MRNLHGTGHGKNAKAKSLGSRHAALPVNAAAALALFLYQSHKKKTKPKEVELRRIFEKQLMETPSSSWFKFALA